MHPLRRTFCCTLPVDLRLTLGPLQHGSRDPTILFDGEGAWWATRSVEGPATIRLKATGQEVSAEAWGTGAGAALESAPALVGAADPASEFVCHHPQVRDLFRRLPGLRLGRTGAVMQALIPAIIEQKVTSIEAHRAWARLVQRYGEPAPGPAPLILPPHPEVLASLPYYAFHPLGIERRRAAAIGTACSQARRLEDAAKAGLDGACKLLLALPGVGAWTAAEVAKVAVGDLDAVSTGDYHLPHLVSFNLAGRPRGTDEEMIELLEPYRPQRARVIRLLEVGGRRPPRRGPRMALRSIERI